MENIEKQLTIFDDYKKGFEEVKKMVSGFKKVSRNTEKIFINSRQEVLNQQLEMLKVHEEEIYEEVKEYLAKANSKILALEDTRSFLTLELNKCQEISSKIQSEESTHGGVLIEEKEIDVLRADCEEASGRAGHDPTRACTGT